MATMIHARLLLLAILCLVPLHPALAEEPSPWSEAKGGAIRLIPGAAATAEGRGAGLEIRLDQGWKTYWRNPGDSGVPPTFDWSRSENLAGIEVAWPAPEALRDETGTSIGYKSGVILPLSVHAKDSAKPVLLALDLDYALCETICVPAKGEARLRLDPGAAGSPASQTALAASLSTVPRRVPIGDGKGSAILSVQEEKAGPTRSLIVSVRDGGDPSLFAEGEADWYLPVPEPVAVPPGSGASHAFRVTFDGLPKAAKLDGATVRLTLVDRSDAVESLYTLP
jgi:DsbC/DsbD-like thiol-disulfide interchange protein